MARDKTSKSLDPYHLLSSEAITNPYPIYHRLRSEDPVHWSNLLGGAWLITRYADVATALRDPRLVASYRSTFWPLNIDLPDRSRFQAAAQRFFTPRAADRLRDRIQAIADELLNAVQNMGRMDLIEEFAYPLPAIVIAELLGIAPEDRDLLKQWSDDLVTFLVSGQPTAEIMLRAQRSAQTMTDYLRTIISRRHREPKDDLITHLFVEYEGCSLFSEEELLAMCIFLAMAGHETTTNLIGNGLFSLLRSSDQLQKLQKEPSLIASAIEELLRYDAPVQWVARMAEEECEIGGTQIHRRERVILILGAANRDPVRFPDPDRLDITRSDNQHLAFGLGKHFCLGAALGRAEGQIAIGTIIRRFPTLQLETEAPPRWQHDALRGLRSLPVVFDEIR
jgi:pimeloyl-[acyl-carrier protein] synthase